MIIATRKSIKAASLVAALLCSSSAFAQSGSWTITESKGQVFVGKSGVSKIALKGSKLSIGDTVKTGKKGRAVLTRGEQYMVVSPNTHIRIAQPEQKGYATRIVEYFGNVLFKVDKKKHKHFEVKTPYMAAVVKGTTFNVAVGAEGSTVQVTEGAVEVSTLDGAAQQLLTPGMIGLVERGDPLALNIVGKDAKRIESPNRVKARPTDKVKPNRPITKAAPQKAPLRIASVITEAPVTSAQNSNAISPSNSAVSSSVRSVSDNVKQSVAASETEIAISNPVALNQVAANAVVNRQIASVSSAAVVPAEVTNDSVASVFDTGAILGDDNVTLASLDNDNVDLGADAANEESVVDDVNDAAVVDLAGTNEADEVAANLSGEEANAGDLNYGADQVSGTCEGIENCASGANPNDVAAEEFAAEDSGNSDNGIGETVSGIAMEQNGNGNNGIGETVSGIAMADIDDGGDAVVAELDIGDSAVGDDDIENVDTGGNDDVEAEVEIAASQGGNSQSGAGNSWLGALIGNIASAIDDYQNNNGYGGVRRDDDDNDGDDD